jgi:Druantia protein DruA
MPVTIGGGLSFCGRELTPQELDLVRQITREFSSLALTELAHTVCELLEWRRPNGSLKSRECYLFLRALHDRGWLPWLPRPQARTRRPRTIVLDRQSEVQSPLTGALGDYLPLRLQMLENREDRRLFQQYIQRYHYLGYRVPYGAQLRYFVRSQPPPYPLLACLLFTSAFAKMRSCMGPCQRKCLRRRGVRDAMVR